EKFPGVCDGVLFEIIAERKIAEHFKKGVMAFGETDVFEVVVLAASADAFLSGGGAVVVSLFEAEKNVLELVHSGVGEKQRGIAVGNERAAANAAMALALKETEKGLANLVAGPLFAVFRHSRLFVIRWPTHCYRRHVNAGLKPGATKPRSLS